MENKNILWGAGIGLAVILSVISLTKGTPTPNVVVNVPPSQTVQNLGATPGTDFQDYYSFGNVRYFSRQIGINSATNSVLCVIPNPFASSTLVAFSAKVRGNLLGTVTADLATTSSIATYVIAGTSTPAYIRAVSIPVALASTTNQLGITWAGGAGTSTPFIIGSAPGAVALGVVDTNGVSNNVIKGSEALVLKIASSTQASAFTAGMTGTCNYTFREL